MASPFKDAYGDDVLLHRWNWHDRRIMAWINNFVKITGSNTLEDVDRQKIKDTGKLRRSLAWKTWATSGGDEQVFRAQYIYYAKFVELALGKHNPYNGPVPEIQAPRWKPITVPTRSRKAKPHVVTEMRRQANRFRVYATEYFQFTGLVTMIYAMGEKKKKQQTALVLPLTTKRKKLSCKHELIVKSDLAITKVQFRKLLSPILEKAA